MLHITDLTYRIQGRALFEGASAHIAPGWKAGLVGRNGTGKSTLLRLIREGGEGEAVRLKRGARLGFVAQEIAAGPEALLDVVLRADEERSALLAEAETATSGERIAEIHARLYDIDAHSAEARAAEILTGLGFSQADLSRATHEFSGGWRMRAALGGVLFATPDLLMLDEPTNYLDLEGAAWLEAHLKRYPNTVLLVSHDRDVLNRAVTHILALDQGKLSVHPGGYDSYLRKKAEQASLLSSMRAKQDAERARLQAFVDRFRAKASKARQAQSRVKMLERMQDITVPLEERTTPFRFESPAEAASPLLQLEDADLGYGAEAIILRRVGLRLDHDDRVAIVGANGQGKTTLVKAIGGKLALCAGVRRAAKGLRIGYFSQDQLDELHGEASVLEHVREARPEASQAAQRAIAAQLGFSAEKVATKAGSLSGGEKVRLLLGLIALQKPHILILDEPTSHLDIDSREALAQALNDYEGAVLLITHDVYLAEACADRVWLVNDGRAAPFEGDLEDYRALVLSAERKPAAAAAFAAPDRNDGPAPRAQGPKPKPAALKKRVENADKQIAAAQVALRRLDEALAAAGAGADFAGLARQRADAAAALEAAEAEWLEASAALEALG